MIRQADGNFCYKRVHGLKFESYAREKVTALLRTCCILNIDRPTRPSPPVEGSSRNQKKQESQQSGQQQLLDDTGPLMIPQCRRHAGQQDSLLTIIRWEHDF
jgi:hypothetical protein